MTKRALTIEPGDLLVREYRGEDGYYCLDALGYCTRRLAVGHTGTGVILPARMPTFIEPPPMCEGLSPELDHCPRLCLHVELTLQSRMILERLPLDTPRPSMVAAVSAAGSGTASDIPQALIDAGLLEPLTDSVSLNDRATAWSLLRVLVNRKMDAYSVAYILNRTCNDDSRITVSRNLMYLSHVFNKFTGAGH